MAGGWAKGKTICGANRNAHFLLFSLISGTHTQQGGPFALWKRDCNRKLLVCYFLTHYEHGATR